MVMMVVLMQCGGVMSSKREAKQGLGKSHSKSECLNTYSTQR